MRLLGFPCGHEQVLVPGVGRVVTGVGATVRQRRRRERRIGAMHCGQAQIGDGVECGECFGGGSDGFVVVVWKGNIYGRAGMIPKKDNCSNDDDANSDQDQVARSYVPSRHVFDENIFKLAVAASKVTELNLGRRVAHHLASQ